MKRYWIRAMRVWLALVLSGAALAAAAATATERQVILVGAGGEQVRIGRLTLTPDGPDAWRFKLDLDLSKFEERFLAMRPFKCLLGKRQDWCYFPYGSEDRVTRTDLQPLEYALMFLHKRPPDVNVDSRNGLYFRLRWEGDKLTGDLYDVDMEPIIVPDGQDPRRPITYKLLQPADPGSYRFSRILIE